MWNYGCRKVILLLKSDLTNTLNKLPGNYTNLRNYATKKRFYKKASILHSDGKFEITLDQRKLKTPTGKVFTVASEPLALAVAAEWDSQKDKIVQANMHLTSLCNTVQDNPNKLTKFDVVNYLTNYIATDTLLFQSSEQDDQEDLYKLQQEKWEPVIEWFCERFNVKVDRSRDLSTPGINNETKATLTRYLLSYDSASVNAISFGVDSLKSVILMIACVERFIEPDTAVLLSRLEEEFQAQFWGRVEWSHDLSQQELQARVSAALFLVQCHAFSFSSRVKKAQEI